MIEVAAAHSGCLNGDYSSSWNADRRLRASLAINTFHSTTCFMNFLTRLLPTINKKTCSNLDMGDGEEFVSSNESALHHIQVFKHHVHSYRELPTVSPKFHDAPRKICVHWSSTCECFSTISLSTQNNPRRIPTCPPVDYRCEDFNLTGILCLLLRDSSRYSN